MTFHMKFRNAGLSSKRRQRVWNPLSPHEITRPPSPPKKGKNNLAVSPWERPGQTGRVVSSPPRSPPSLLTPRPLFVNFLSRLHPVFVSVTLELGNQQSATWHPFDRVTETSQVVT